MALGIPRFGARWGPHEIALLGTAPDAEFARELGKAANTVGKQRIRLGVPLFTFDWTNAEDSLLGTDTDRAIAKVLGSTEGAVRRRRWKLGIEAYCKLRPSLGGVRAAESLTFERTIGRAPHPAFGRPLPGGEVVS